MGSGNGVIQKGKHENLFSYRPTAEGRKCRAPPDEPQNILGAHAGRADHPAEDQKGYGDKMSKFFMGVDPGATGAAAFINEAGAYICFCDYPGSAAELANQLTMHIGGPDARNLEVFAVIEQVHAMPKQGVSSTGKFMKNAGIWEGIIAALKIPYELITPQRWRKILDSSVPKKPTKEDLRAYAIKRWPAAADDLKRVKDHNRAEALLLAEFARLKHLGKIL